MLLMTFIQSTFPFRLLKNHTQKMVYRYSQLGYFFISYNVKDITDIDKIKRYNGDYEPISGPEKHSKLDREALRKWFKQKCGETGRAKKFLQDFLLSSREHSSL